MRMMKPVRWTVLLLVAQMALLMTTVATQAQEVPFEGTINQDGATLRAGAGTPYYIVGQAKKGTHVTVVERIAEWYQISPPPGVYSYVSKAFVDVRGDGSTGTVRQRMSAYAASVNGPGESYRRQLELLAGTVVKIVGEDGSYFKIEPPKGSYVYIQTNQIDVATEKMTPAPAAEKTPAAEVAPEVAPEKTPEPVKQPAPVVKPEPAAPTPAPEVKPVVTPEPAAPSKPVAAVDTTAKQPTPAPQDVPAVDTPADTAVKTTTPTPAAPADASADTSVKVVVDNPVKKPQVKEEPVQRPLVVSPNLMAAENAFYEAQQLPVEKQPLAALKAQYEALQHDDSLTIGDQRVLAVRLAQIERNIGLAKAIDNLREVRRDLKPSTTILNAPAKPAGPQHYDAMGQLLASSVYDGGTLPRLYRLVTAGEGRTIAYVRPTGNFDPVKALGSTVGIVGKTRYDTALKLRVIDAEQLVILEPAVEN